MKSSWKVSWLLVCLFLTGCQMSVLNPAGRVAEEQSRLIIFSFAVMMIILLVVFVLFFRFLWRYREDSRIERPPHTQENDNKKLEITWTVLPLLVLLLLAVPMLMQTYSLETKTTQEEMTIEVTGQQYWWRFDYPDENIRTAQELHLPANTNITFELNTEDVIHSFWIPQLGGKKDAIPGRTNELHLETGRPGVYEGKCAELCGAAHTDMRFQVVVHEEEDFTDWVEAAGQDVTPEENETVQEEGARVFQENCLACHAADGAATKNDQGPNLALYGERDKISGSFANDEEQLKAFLRHPNNFKPSTDMPAYNNLSREEMDALVNYLHGLTRENVQGGSD
ncbi:cytochrome c oxidase subunit II [Salibacterium aidingense]|uniref:cytochrome c oxidase subunit II n=1 Tax=Salibacterium aidingense TaxID=384933 RepID=UPI003BE6B7BE